MYNILTYFDSVQIILRSTIKLRQKFKIFTESHAERHTGCNKLVLKVEEQHRIFNKVPNERPVLTLIMRQIPGWSWPYTLLHAYLDLCKTIIGKAWA